MNGNVIYGSSERNFDVIDPFVQATEKVIDVLIVYIIIILTIVV